MQKNFSQEKFYLLDDIWHKQTQVVRLYYQETRIMFSNNKNK